jgi:hypothetical protein
MKLLAGVLAFAVLAPPDAFAGAASDAVRFFYEGPTFEPDPSVRDHFIDPAKTKFEQNDQNEGCIDWVLAIDAQDVDDATLAKTLKLTEAVNGDAAEVTAIFTLFPDNQESSKREILWTLKEIDGAWKIADIASKTSGWKLSELECQ